ncbi:MAG TPA: tRNA (N6-threonylcarbamoyladenosine(37)-N6)-methyltransferase TrmO [bacterium]|nr:tRNA (N6-threonylcarbamoyladenosine(37)-N6)-methyltransferase TrmO [bacterium]HPJ72939.1 tRNA (N6-threonylcarbamoyladenosine(37)-N6)-methyltransferase TrmO [bacterium]HPQ67060.1 tRNA (N6-threonylcarbamoyladenosine(37)-N6)-methyltransferase TrmO [bacterium]
MKTFNVEPIGIIHSPFATKEECPIQPGLSEAPGRVEVFPRYGEGLETIESFTHIYLFYVFDRAGEIMLSRPTFLDDDRHGVFASRHPCRPNGIGMSIVRLEGRTGNELRVRGIDVLDGTPLIDIKPYIPRFDYFENAGNGWVEGRDNRPKPADRE